jgi:cobalt-zinc-cadmium efflux system membrane fusion protein
MKSQDNFRQARIAVPIVLVLSIASILITRNGNSAAKQTSQAPAADTSVITMSTTGQRALQIQTTPVRLESLEGTLKMTGLISYPTDQTVKISPRVQGGRVNQVFVEVGDHVAAGETIAKIESADAAAALATENQNIGNLRLTKATLEHTQQQFRLGTPEVTAAKATFDQAIASVAFNKDALDKIQEQARIGGFTEQPLETAESNLVTAQSSAIQSQADLDTDKTAYDRMVKLVAIGVNSQQDLEAATNALAHAKANANANQKLLDQAKEAVAREQAAFKTNLYADQAVRAQENNYQQSLLQRNAAQRALQIANAAVLADLQTAQTNYQNAVSAELGSRPALPLLGNPQFDGSVSITSPISGVVVERDVNPGQVVDTSQETPWQMFVISNPSRVWVQGEVYEEDVASVAVGEPVAIHVDAYPTRSFTGVVHRIAPSLDAKTRAIDVLVEIPNPNGLFKDGMYAEMSVRTGRTQTDTVVPINALQHDADTDYVYVQQGKQYVRRNVGVGDQKNGMCEIKTGLKQGDLVVTQGAIFLGTQVSDD